MTLANKITIARIALIPCFVLMAIYYGRGVARGEPLAWQYWTAIAIFVTAAASDGIDGWIARRFNQRSQLGVILDLLADKGLLLSAVITLSLSRWPYEFPLWFPVIVIARDTIVLVGAFTLHLLNGHVKVKPSFTGKIATFLQMVAIGMCMLQWNLFSHAVEWWGVKAQVDFLDLPVLLATIFTTISGVGYVMDGIRQIHEKGHGDPKPWSDG